MLLYQKRSSKAYEGLAVWDQLGEDISPATPVYRDNIVYSSGSYALIAPIHPPNGATVTELKLHYNDSETADLFVALDGINLATRAQNATSFLVTSADDGAGSVTQAGSLTIDNNANTYKLVAGNTSSTRTIAAVVLTYTITAP